jgi:N-acetylmuramic acid 6-phosphate etherase
MTSDEIFAELAGLVTESRNPDTLDIDLMDTMEIVNLINKEDHKIAPAVAGEIPYIVQAVEMICTAFRNGGRLIYIGAGTSGRIGILDAVECPPTFGSDPQLIQGIIAGGYTSLVQAQEGCEDDYELGAADIREKGITVHDVVCGLAASQRTPYVIGALQEAKQSGAKTIFVICNPRKEIKVNADVLICPVPGPEVIMGSTRMKAGSAQKMILNILTTTVMIKSGKVYQNMMVDLQQNSKKLIERSKKIIMIAANVSYKQAQNFLEQSNGRVKSAILMAMTNLDAETVEKLLAKNEGFIKRVLLEKQKGK